MGHRERTTPAQRCEFRNKKADASLGSPHKDIQVRQRREEDGSNLPACRNNANRAHITYSEIQLLRTDNWQMLNIRTKECFFSWRA